MSWLAVVTATIDNERAAPCISSWLTQATQGIDLYIVRQTVQRADWYRCVSQRTSNQVLLYDSREILGVVPAFARGVQKALEDGHAIIACLHDDLEIEQPGWDDDVRQVFKVCPHAGLVGFGGAMGLGDDDIYKTPYNPMQLVRKRFGSNMRHAEAHGERWEVPYRVAVLDGFSQIGLRNYWLGRHHSSPGSGSLIPGNHLEGPANLFTTLQEAGVIHHAYDAALGAYARRLGYQVWFTPVKVHHHGGLTAVADPRYHEWASHLPSYQRTTREGLTPVARGDQAIWERSHQIVYEMFRGVLPIRV